MTLKQKALLREGRSTFILHQKLPPGLESLLVRIVLWVVAESLARPQEKRTRMRKFSKDLKARATRLRLRILEFKHPSLLHDCA